MKTLFSIGALCKATGVPVETIRTWERRYGFPVPIRTESGHRRYPVSTVERLRLVKKLLDRGHKPSTVVSAAPEELRALLGWQARAEKVAPLTNPLSDESLLAGLPSSLHGWLSSVHTFDGPALDQAFRKEWGKLSAHSFVSERAGPFLHALGNLWAKGEVSVMQEHFASERLRDFLVEQWRPLSDKAPGPRLVLANLSGDRHALGLHFAAVVLAVADCEAIFLGADTPVSEICAAMTSFKAQGLVLSVSSTVAPSESRRQLSELRDAIDKRLPIVVGGAGALAPAEGILHIQGFEQLTQWAESLPRRRRPSRRGSAPGG